MPIPETPRHRPSHKLRNGICATALLAAGVQRLPNVEAAILHGSGTANPTSPIVRYDINRYYSGLLHLHAKAPNTAQTPHVNDIRKALSSAEKAYHIKAKTADYLLVQDMSNTPRPTFEAATIQTGPNKYLVAKEQNGNVSVSKDQLIKTSQKGATTYKLEVNKNAKKYLLAIASPTVNELGVTFPTTNGTIETTATGKVNKHTVKDLFTGALRLIGKAPKETSTPIAVIDPTPTIGSPEPTPTLPPGIIKDSGYCDVTPNKVNMPQGLSGDKMVSERDNNTIQISDDKLLKTRPQLGLTDLYSNPDDGSLYAYIANAVLLNIDVFKSGNAYLELGKTDAFCGHYSETVSIDNIDSSVQQFVYLGAPDYNTEIINPEELVTKLKKLPPYTVLETEQIINPPKISSNAPAYVRIAFDKAKEHKLENLNEEIFEKLATKSQSYSQVSQTEIPGVIDAPPTDNPLQYPNISAFDAGMSFDQTQ